MRQYLAQRKQQKFELTIFGEKFDRLVDKHFYYFSANLIKPNRFCQN